MTAQNAIQQSLADDSLPPGRSTLQHLDQDLDSHFLAELNAWFAGLDAPARVAWALRELPDVHMLSSSFGSQAAVSLHMLSSAKPDIPVVLLDTGYLFPETHDFVSELRERLQLNLHTYRNPMSPVQQELVYGKRWLQGADGIDRYNYDNKVAPMRRALAELHVGTWFSGIRRSQAVSRKETPFVQLKDGLVKVSPIADWTDKDVFDYLSAHDLPYHPLWHKGYISIGDVHTTKSLPDVDDPSQVRFFGLKRECGLHN